MQRCLLRRLLWSHVSSWVVGTHLLLSLPVPRCWGSAACISVLACLPLHAHCPPCPLRLPLGNSSSSHPCGSIQCACLHWHFPLLNFPEHCFALVPAPTPRPPCLRYTPMLPARLPALNPLNLAHQLAAPSCSKGREMAAELFSASCATRAGDEAAASMDPSGLCAPTASHVHHAPFIFSCMSGSRAPDSTEPVAFHAGGPRLAGGAPKPF